MINSNLNPTSLAILCTLVSACAQQDQYDACGGGQHTSARSDEALAVLDGATAQDVTSLFRSTMSSRPMETTGGPAGDWSLLFTASSVETIIPPPGLSDCPYPEEHVSIRGNAALTSSDGLSASGPFRLVATAVEETSIYLDGTLEVDPTSVGHTTVPLNSDETATYFLAVGPDWRADSTAMTYASNLATPLFLLYPSVRSSDGETVGSTLDEYRPAQ